MAYQIISLSNDQYLTKDGTKLQVNGRLGAIGGELEAKVLLDVTNAKVEIGTPYLPFSQKLKVLDYVKGPKTRVAIYKAKSRYRKAKGHRQWQTILELVVPTAKPPAKKTTLKAK